MRTRLRYAALALAGTMSFAASARLASAGESDFGYCKMACGAVAATCGAAGGGVEFCGGMLSGCIYGCGIKAAE
jgi:hypothetical protein